eukprot:gene7273-11591_t
MSTKSIKKFIQAQDSIEEILEIFKELKDFSGVKKEDNSATIYKKIKEESIDSQNKDLWLSLSKKFVDPPKNPENKNLDILIIGAGPGGLKCAIDCAFIPGTNITVIEKRNDFTRNNVMHLWPYTVEELKSIGVKTFYRKFCSGGLNHIGIKRLQFILFKIALLLGVKFYFGTDFISIESPEKPDSDWTCITSPKLDNVHFNVIVGADGERCILADQLKFPRKSFGGSLAIGITGNFQNLNKFEDSSLNEFGISYQFKKTWFNDLHKNHGIRLENATYYRDETHYYVVTGIKSNLLEYGVLKNDSNEISELLDPSNVDRKKLEEYLQVIAKYCKLPEGREFKMNKNGDSDVAIFDFTTKWFNSYSTKIFETHGKNKLLAGMVGDALIAPFWPQGTGCNRAFISSHNLTWSIYNFLSQDPKELLSFRETTYFINLKSNSLSIKEPFKTITKDPKTLLKDFPKQKPCEKDQYDKELFGKKIEIEE